MAQGLPSQDWAVSLAAQVSCVTNDYCAKHKVRPDPRPGQIDLGYLSTVDLISLIAMILRSAPVSLLTHSL